MVNKQEVKEVAENARIELSSSETEQFAEEFENILETFDKLEEVETESVDPAFHPIQIDSKKREDQKGETLSREEVFQNTDNEENGSFKAPSA